MKSKLTVFCTLAFLFLFTMGLCAQYENDLKSLYEKEKITVVITDSGLGGLSVMDYLADRLKETGCYRQVNLIFVNALFDENTGYNTLQTREEKISVFNGVLEGIDKEYNPDVILIACNTLSVIYRDTEFAVRAKIPLIGIVEPGVELILSKLETDPTSSVIILGTETTIAEDSHRKALLMRNITDDRIVTEPCPQLQSYIEEDPGSEMVSMLISFYLDEALQQIPRNQGKVYLSLNCSHFGYSMPLWKRACESTDYDFGTILDPNNLMCDVLLPVDHLGRFQSTMVNFEVVSKVRIVNVKTMAGFFSNSSPELAEAIENYKIIPALF